MTCENCDPSKFVSGGIVKVSKDLEHCAVCGGNIRMLLDKVRIYSQSKWDKYFHSICVVVASKSPCLSRKTGAILVRDHSIISTGYNGPARGVTHCGQNRLMKESTDFVDKIHSYTKEVSTELALSHCPRKLMGYLSGTGLEWCTAIHAEVNCVINAARLGVSTLNSILYMNRVIPCKDCFSVLINAGVVEVVIDNAKVYDKHTQFVIDNSNIKIREFEDV